MIRLILPVAAALLVAAAPAPPAQLFGKLYHDVQMARLFPDSKTFADAQPRRAAKAIVAA